MVSPSYFLRQFEGCYYGSFFNGLSRVTSTCLQRQDLLPVETITVTEGGAVHAAYHLPQKRSSCALVSSVGYLAVGLAAQALLSLSGVYKWQQAAFEETGKLRIQSAAKKIQKKFKSYSWALRTRKLYSLTFEIKNKRYHKDLSFPDGLRERTLEMIKISVCNKDRNGLRLLLNAYFSGNVVDICNARFAEFPPDKIDQVECDGDSLKMSLLKLIGMTQDLKSSLEDMGNEFIKALEAMKTLVPIHNWGVKAVQQAGVNSAPKLWVEQAEGVDPESWIPFCHGGSLTFLGDFLMNKHPGVPIVAKKLLGIWVHPMQLDFRVETYAMRPPTFSNFDRPARLTGEIQAKALLAVDNVYEAFVTNEQLRGPHCRNLRLEPLCEW